MAHGFIDADVAVLMSALAPGVFVSSVQPCGTVWTPACQEADTVLLSCLFLIAVIRPARSGSAVDGAVSTDCHQQ
jgi:hypothetical protein